MLFFRYISKIDNHDDAVEYLEGLLDINNEEHLAAISAFLKSLPDAKEDLIVSPNISLHLSFDVLLLKGQILVLLA